MKSTLSPVIRVIEEKCVNCHKCIAVCPVKACNDGSGNHVSVNADLCIGCGACVKECSHGAREGIDDSAEFFKDLAARKPVVAIVAPAVTASFGQEYLKINTLLKNLGAKAVFDVAFGAELTVKSYLDELEKEDVKCVIAQPCPALVTFAELYEPGLLKYFAKVGSPMDHTVKMIRASFPEYRDCAIAAISPCFAKKREFDEIGDVKYNVTFASLKKYMAAKNVSLRHLDRSVYDGPWAGSASLFPMPGGLLRTVEREVGDAQSFTKRVEGQQAYEYLPKLANALKTGSSVPYRLIDCLSCENGCSMGPGSLVDEDQMTAENSVEKRAQLARGYFQTFKKGQLAKSVKKFHRADFKRTYVDRSATALDADRLLSAKELAATYLAMHKESEKDVLNCCACGYRSCADMAKAIFNRRNKPENCKHYIQKEISLEHARRTESIKETLSGISKQGSKLLGDSLKKTEALADHASDMSTCVVESSAAIEEMVANVGSISKTLEFSSQSISLLYEASEAGSKGVTDMAKALGEILRQSEFLGEVSKIIEDVAGQTNLLSMNAAIEAAHAGESGRGFAVVASEIRKLAEKTDQHSKQIAKSLQTMKNLMDGASSSAEKSTAQFASVVNLTNKVKDENASIKGAIQEQSAGGRQVLEALAEMNTLTVRVKDEADALRQSSENVIEEMGKLTAI